MNACTKNTLQRYISVLFSSQAINYMRQDRRWYTRITFLLYVFYVLQKWHYWIKLTFGEGKNLKEEKILWSVQCTFLICFSRQSNVCFYHLNPHIVVYIFDHIYSIWTNYWALELLHASKRKTEYWRKWK